METAVTRIEGLVLSAGIDKRKVRGELARICGISYQAVASWFTGPNNPDMKNLEAIANYYKVRREWLETGFGPQSADDESIGPINEEDYELIPQYAVHGSCGPGAIHDYVEVKGSLAFRKEWLRGMGLNGCRLSVIYAKGDSNYPTIEDGQVMLINHDDTTPRSGKLYLLLLGEDLIVKRLHYHVTQWVISSDNPDKSRYPDTPIQADQIHNLKIDGRVVWWGGEL